MCISSACYEALIKQWRNVTNNCEKSKTSFSCGPIVGRAWSHVIQSSLAARAYRPINGQTVRFAMNGPIVSSELDSYWVAGSLHNLTIAIDYIDSVVYIIYAIASYLALNGTSPTLARLSLDRHFTSINDKKQTTTSAVSQIYHITSSVSRKPCDKVFLFWIPIIIIIIWCRLQHFHICFVSLTMPHGVKYKLFIKLLSFSGLSHDTVSICLVIDKYSLASLQGQLRCCGDN